MSLVTIARFGDAHTAYLAKSRLEAEGIEAFVADDALIQMNWLYAIAVGGAKVQVDEADAPRAETLLGRNHAAELKNAEEAQPGRWGRNDLARLAEAEETLRKQDAERSGDADFLTRAWPALVIIVIALGLIGLYSATRRVPGF